MLICVHDAKPRSIFPRHVDYGYRQRGTVVNMLLQHIAVVHLIDVVTGQDQQILWIDAVDIVDVLIDGMRSSCKPLAAIWTGVWLQDRHARVQTIQSPAGPITNVPIQNQGLILRDYANIANA